jgi:hypothetical protein
MSKKFNAVVIGKRNTGKSVLISELLYYISKQKVPRACVFSATEESNRFFCNHIPDSFIFDDKDVDARLTALINQQQELQMKKQLGEIPADTDLRIVIVLDDIGYNKQALSSEIIRAIFMNGRHYDIILIVALQHIMQLGVALRSNCDYIICLKEGNKDVKKNLYKNFFGAFEKLSHFETAFDACTKDYGCMIMDNTTGKTDVDGSTCWYKATPGRKFRVGSKAFWGHHESRYVTIVDRYKKKAEAKEEDTETSARNGSFVVRREK